MPKDSESLTIARFEVELWWSNVEVDNPEAWWVYLLRQDAREDDPCYVGMARNVCRRLTEHRRGWMADYGGALLIATWSEAEARRLETAFISLFDPRNNTQKPTLSWVEHAHFAKLRREWEADALSLCPGCKCLCESTNDGLMPQSEPDPTCTEHAGPARLELARSVLDNLMIAAGFESFTQQRRREVSGAFGLIMANRFPGWPLSIDTEAGL